MEQRSGWRCAAPRALERLLLAQPFLKLTPQILLHRLKTDALHRGQEARELALFGIDQIEALTLHLHHLLVEVGNPLLPIVGRGFDQRLAKPLPRLHLSLVERPLLLTKATIDIREPRHLIRGETELDPYALREPLA